MCFNQVCLQLLFWKTKRELGTPFLSAVDQIIGWNDVYINSSYLTRARTQYMYDRVNTFSFTSIFLV
jgi:hypothetical protein